MLKNGRKGLFGHKRGKGNRFLSLALSAAMLAGSVPSSAFSVYAESSITYGSSDDDVDSYAEGYEDAYSDAGNTDPGLIYGTDEEPASYEEPAYTDNLPAGDTLQEGVPGESCRCIQPHPLYFLIFSVLLNGFLANRTTTIFGRKKYLCPGD